MKIAIPTGIFFTVALIVSGAALAAKPKDPAKEAMRRMQLEFSQLQDEKAGIATELDALKKKTDGLESSASRAEHRSAALAREVSALQQEKSRLSEKLGEMERMLEQSKKEGKETHDQLVQETTIRKKTEQNLGARQQELAQCISKNQNLVGYQVELINRAQSEGGLGVFLRAEPFTGLGRIKVENILEEYRDKVEEQKIVPLPGTNATAAVK